MVFVTFWILDFNQLVQIEGGDEGDGRVGEGTLPCRPEQARCEVCGGGTGGLLTARASPGAARVAAHLGCKSVTGVGS